MAAIGDAVLIDWYSNGWPASRVDDAIMLVLKRACPMDGGYHESFGISRSREAESLHAIHFNKLIASSSHASTPSKLAMKF